MLDVYLRQLELAYFELGEAFKGLKDENVWKRPAEGLLSVGEIAGHVAHWAALRLVGDGGCSGTDPTWGMSTCPVTSPLIDPRFRYYTNTREYSPSAEQRAMTADQVWREVLRVHKEVMALFNERNVDLAGHPPTCPPNLTYEELLKYQAFHVAYHAGQIYMTRHLLGEETVDN
jgi:uncharacterized damage-inducible protein DinB